MVLRGADDWSQSTSGFRLLDRVLPSFLVTVRILRPGASNDDSYENGASKAKAGTVTRIASLTPTSPVTVGIFEIFDIKNDDSYEDRKLDTHHPCDCSHF